MKTISALFFLSVIIFGCRPANQKQKSLPNVILIMADDMGWGDVGFNGGTIIKTPALDEMASNGIVFSRFYAAAPVCSPTRGSCLTGRHPYRYGVTTANRGHLKNDEISLAEIFRKKGYATGHFGKWHLGTLDPEFSIHGQSREPRKNYMNPAMAGFDEWFSTELAVPTYDPYSKKNTNPRAWRIDGDWRAVYWHNGAPLNEILTGCDSEIIIDKAIPFIEKNVESDKRFFAVIWFHAPHVPVIGHPVYMQEYYSDYPESNQHYYSSVTALDVQVGRLRERLKELGVSENTIVCFTSDNGPEGSPGENIRWHSHGSAGKYRGRKRSLYEGGVRVPSIIEWPALGINSKTIDVPTVTSDYFPTFCSILGVDHKQFQRPYDGIDLMPIIKGEQTERKSGIGFQTLIQQTYIGERFKIVHNLTEERSRSDNGEVPFSKYELYDLINDPGEKKNLAEQYPEVLSRLTMQLEDWIASCKQSDEGSDYYDE